MASSGRRSLWMQTADPPAFSIISKKCAKESKSRSQQLDSLKKLVLSMPYLETNDIVVFRKSPEIFEIMHTNSNTSPKRQKGSKSFMHMDFWHLIIFPDINFLFFVLGLYFQFLSSFCASLHEV